MTFFFSNTFWGCSVLIGGGVEFADWVGSVVSGGIGKSFHVSCCLSMYN